RDRGGDDDPVDRRGEEVVHRPRDLPPPALPLEADVDLGDHQHLVEITGGMAEPGEDLGAAVDQLPYGEHPDHPGAPGPPAASGAGLPIPERVDRLRGP